jgi:hypothetical protein
MGCLCESILVFSKGLIKQRVANKYVMYVCNSRLDVAIFAFPACCYSLLRKILVSFFVSLFYSEVRAARMVIHVYRYVCMYIGLDKVKNKKPCIAPKVSCLLLLSTFGE